MDTKTKAIVAAVCFVLAVVVIVWQLGVFDSGPVGVSNPEGFDEALDQAEEQVPEGGRIVFEDPASGRSGGSSGARMMPE